MTITSPLVLPADVILTPVAELSEQVRERFECADGDYAITRPRSRTPSRIIDTQAATLLQEFRTAKTIVQAVISYSQTMKTDPEETLTAALPMIERFLDSRLLVFADSREAATIVHSFETGDQIGEFTVLSCVQVLEDTELYQVKRASGPEAALKISRPGADPHTGRMFEREAAILKRLDGSTGPTLFAAGTLQDRPYLAVEWCPGVYVTTVAQELRRFPIHEGRKKLLHLCCAVLDGYARLHAQNVIHSDVHPRNVLVAGDGSIIDYGLARVADAFDELGQAPRGGVGFFFEAEYAKALRADQRPPQSSVSGEQHALAALLYFLFTGAHYLDFSLEKSEMLRQIAEDPMLPFARHSIGAWPDVERVLAKALRKDPADRFVSVAEFGRTLRGVIPGIAHDGRADGGAATRSPPAAIDILLIKVLERVQITGSLFSSGLTTPLKCSINNGAAGIAYALYRIAGLRGDAALLALADIWIGTALRDIGNHAAFFSAELDITPETVGRISPYHTASGLRCVQAFVGQAMGDLVSHHDGIERFILDSKAPCDNLDLTLGRSSSLLACSLLLDTAPDNESLRKFGDETTRGVWDVVNSFAPIRQCRQISYLGIAHGWAGILYATLRWCQASGTALPGQLAERLEQLAGFGEHKGRGARWPVGTSRGSRPADEYMSGWCHGSAGYVHLWTLAHQMCHDNHYRGLAEKVAWSAWEEPESISNLCCGLAGRAYALLHVYKHTGEKDWLHRARQLANKAALGIRDGDVPIDSLYKGEIGIALLSADLSNPESGCMPFFEAEGWPRP